MLNIRDLSKSYGGVKAVNNVTLSLSDRKIVGLIGTNGAGKTSLFNLISGFNTADSGTADFEGNNVLNLQPSEISKLGMIRTFQTPTGFPKMTVMENMLVFSKKIQNGVFSNLFYLNKLSPEIYDQAESILEDFGLVDKKDSWVMDLSAPELKMLEFARASMAKPKLMLLDEPAAGVNPAILDQLNERIILLGKEGVTFLIVDHNLKFICNISEYIYAMSDGQIISEGPPDKVINDQNVIDCYIGKQKH